MKQKKNKGDRELLSKPLEFLKKPANGPITRLEMIGIENKSISIFSKLQSYVPNGTLKNSNSHDDITSPCLSCKILPWYHSLNQQTPLQLAYQYYHPTTNHFKWVGIDACLSQFRCQISSMGGCMSKFLAAAPAFGTLSASKSWELRSLPGLWRPS